MQLWCYQKSDSAFSPRGQRSLAATATMVVIFSLGMKLIVSHLYGGKRRDMRSLFIPSSKKQTVSSVGPLIAAKSFAAKTAARDAAGIEKKGAADYASLEMPDKKRFNFLRDRQYTFLSRGTMCPMDHDIQAIRRETPGSTVGICGNTGAIGGAWLIAISRVFDAPRYRGAGGSHPPRLPPTRSLSYCL